MDDAGSLYGNAQFLDPMSGNFQILENSDALRIGFRNFPMSGFGVTSTELKALAGTPPIVLPEKAAPNQYIRAKAKAILGARVKALDTESEITATGMHVRAGAYLVDVPADSQLAKYGFKGGDVVWQMNQMLTPSVRDFQNGVKNLKRGVNTVKVWRSQEWTTVTF